MGKIRKSFGKFLTSVLTLGMILGLCSVEAFAQEYTYQVTFYSGNQGTFAGADGLSVDNQASGSQYQIDRQDGTITVSGLKAGDIVSFDVQAGAVSMGEDSKYYVRGVRQSGRDNDTVQTSAFRVDGDGEYVVAYGIRGSQAAYTVNYQDADGNELAPSRTYYGNVGDKPVVAYLYVEGYTPQTLALTKTLSENEAENVFTFVYTPVPTEVVTVPGDTVTNTTVETVPGTTTGTTGTGTAGAGAAGTGAAGAGTAGTGAGTEAEQPGTPGEVPGTEQQPDETTEIEEEEVPQDLTDLDEEEVPRSNVKLDKEKVKKGLPLVAGAGIGVLAAVALCAAVFVIRKRMKG